ncbi:hypothetical protein [Sphingomonas asaccharolytica]|uniref:hypothetical protein n=1 Tax=Sphingomonas asaccharolytica TaxID=40681 RepID=UPI000AC218D1|nr:hypothetical protein [Sphingomonas asaccharolytica]
MQLTPHLGRDWTHYPARMLGQMCRLSGVVGENEMVEQRALLSMMLSMADSSPSHCLKRKCRFCCAGARNA